MNRPNVGLGSGFIGKGPLAPMTRDGDVHLYDVDVSTGMPVVEGGEKPFPGAKPPFETGPEKDEKPPTETEGPEKDEKPEEGQKPWEKTKKESKNMVMPAVSEKKVIVIRGM